MSDRTAVVIRALAILSGLVALACTGFLIVNHGAVLLRAAANKERVETLESRVKTDAEIASQLHDERERQTEDSLVRKARGRSAAWVLLVAAGVFVACGKVSTSRRPQAVPSVDELKAIRFPGPPPSARKKGKARTDEPIDLGFVDELVQRFGRGREGAVPILQAIQGHHRYLPDDLLRRVCELTEISPAQIAGTSSFYAQFRRSPVGRHVVRVCHGTACHVAGAEQITQELRRHLEIAPGKDTDPQRLFTIDRVACLGCCSLAPVMMIEDETAGHLTPASARQALDEREPRT